MSIDEQHNLLPRVDWQELVLAGSHQTETGVERAVRAQ